MKSDYNSSFTPYSRRLQHGLAVANRKMMTRASIFGYTLVIGGTDGKPFEKDARQLMDELRHSPWWKEHFDD
ncbi:MAG: hypothetical protein SOT67_01685 [Bacteroidaceae bacterium]|nr:hypothetical protein [Prevotellaceae bacterium]MDY2848967.1 hypothetical protein [Bacteroidaceae bacterium]